MAMNKLDVFTDLLMLYIKDRYNPEKNKELRNTKEKWELFQKAVMTFLKTHLGKKGERLYINWSVKFCDKTVDISEKEFKETEKDNNVKRTFLIEMAELLCEEDELKELDKYQTQEDILEEKYQLMN